VGIPGEARPRKKDEHKPLYDPAVYVQGDGDFI
jgi:serine O-acetyltransferase